MPKGCPNPQNMIIISGSLDFSEDTAQAEFWENVSAVFQFDLMGAIRNMASCAAIYKKKSQHWI